MIKQSECSALKVALEDIQLQVCVGYAISFTT